MLLARTADAHQEADRHGDRPSLRRCYVAGPDAVPRACAAVAWLAKAASLSEARLEAVRLAVAEAVTNAVVHAYAGGRGWVHLTAALAKDELIVSVADDGCGPRRAPRARQRGWGWTVIAASSDEFSISQRTNGGTQVEVRWGLVAHGADTAESP